MISIIMPIYNGERYIKKNISNIIENLNMSYELILVDDGSTDDSWKLIQEYSNEYCQVKGFHKSNGGICSARNYGLKKASGDYVTFIDQDDKCIASNYKKLCEILDNSNSDILIASKLLRLIDANGKIVNEIKYVYDAEEILNPNNVIELFFNLDRKIKLLHIWNCIYKNDILKANNIIFDQYFKYGQEDTMFNLEYILHCNKAILSPVILYEYERRISESTSMSKNAGSLQDFIYFTNKSIKLLSVNNLDFMDDLALYCFRYGLGIYKKNKANKNYQEKKELLKEIFNTCSQKGLNPCRARINFNLYYVFVKFILSLCTKSCFGFAVIVLDRS